MKKLSLFLLVSVFIFSLVVPIKGASAQTKFKDVGSNHWAYNEIDYLSGKNIIKGYPDGSFQPDKPINRLQAVFMMINAKGITDFSNVPDPHFADMNSSSYGYDQVAKAVQLGMISGKANATGQKIFDSNGILTRAQMAIILSQAYNLTGSNGLQFKDVPNTFWAYSGIEALASNNITVGHGNGLFGPNDPLTRAQFSVMMAKTLDKSFRITPPTTTEPTGKTYPDGWTAPVLKSSWSPNQAQNFTVLQNELGFTEGGHTYGIQGASHAIVVMQESGNLEVMMKFSMWDGDANGQIPQAYRIPIVAKELFKLYFGGDATRVWNYFNSNDIPDNFTANGRNVTGYFSPADGSVYLQVGKK